MVRTRILDLIVLIVGIVTTTTCGLSDIGAPALVGSTDAPSIPLICCGCHHRVSRSDCYESGMNGIQAPDFETDYYMWWANDAKDGCPGDYNYLVDQTEAGCFAAMNVPRTKIESQIWPISGDVVHCSQGPGGHITLVDGTWCQ